MASSLRILAVDDEPAIAASMHYIFARPLYDVTSAQDGEDALTRLAAEPDPFDVVITDNNMPHCTGVELVRQLRERHFPGKIMVLSAHLSEELRAAYQKLEVDLMLEKPFNVRDLRQALAEVAG